MLEIYVDNRVSTGVQHSDATEDGMSGTRTWKDHQVLWEGGKRGSVALAT
jgi:hypothetical protein